MSELGRCFENLEKARCGRRSSVFKTEDLAESAHERIWLSSGWERDGNFYLCKDIIMDIPLYLFIAIYRAYPVPTDCIVSRSFDLRDLKGSVNFLIRSILIITLRRIKPSLLSEGRRKVANALTTELNGRWLRKIDRERTYEGSNKATLSISIRTYFSIVF